jgi:hypothetical protein
VVMGSLESSCGMGVGDTWPRGTLFQFSFGPVKLYDGPHPLSKLTHLTHSSNVAGDKGPCDRTGRVQRTRNPEHRGPEGQQTPSGSYEYQYQTQGPVNTRQVLYH